MMSRTPASAFLPPSAQSPRRRLSPAEYSVARHGINTQTTAVPILPATPILSLLLPDFSSWGDRASAVRARLPLLWRFVRELERKHTAWFWGLVVGNIALGLVPAAELYFARGLIDIASAVGYGLPLDLHLFGFVLGGRVATALGTELLGRLTSTFENHLLSSFALRIQQTVLRIHLSLQPDKLASPRTTRKLAVLRELGSSTSVYHRVFNPLAPISIVQSIVGVGVGVGMLYRGTSWANGVCLGIAVGSLLVDEWEVAGWGRKVVVEHWDVTNDAYLRFQSLFKLGTSTRLRREVHTLGLQPFILDSATTALDSLGDVDTTPPNSVSFHAPLSPLGVLRSLSNTCSTTAFILYSAFLRPRNLLCNFAELSVVESAVWNVRVQWAGVVRGGREVEEGLEKLEVLYEAWPELEAAGGRREVKVATRVDESGKEWRGLEIELVEVTLIYEGSDAPALLDVSLRFLPGQLVCAVGHNGSGKSSLVALLSQEVKPTKGTILVNGHPIEDYDRLALAKAMSFVFQSTPALPLTVRELLTLGAEAAIPPADFATALAVSGAADVVATLEHGLDSYVTPASTELESFALPQAVAREPGPPALEWFEDSKQAKVAPSEEGQKDWTLVEGEKDVADEETGRTVVRKAEVSLMPYPVLIDHEEATVTFEKHSPQPLVLSGGQWQRLLLCRSLLSPASHVLCWDEPTAALDPVVEASLFDHLFSRVHRRKTVLLTTHRFGVTAKADLVVVFEKGRVVEQGSHGELMGRAGGHYKRLYELQADGFREA